MKQSEDWNWLCGNSLGRLESSVTATEGVWKGNRGCLSGQLPLFRGCIRGGEGPGLSPFPFAHAHRWPDTPAQSPGVVMSHRCCLPTMSGCELLPLSLQTPRVVRRYLCSHHVFWGRAWAASASENPRTRNQLLRLHIPCQADNDQHTLRKVATGINTKNRPHTTYIKPIQATHINSPLRPSR